MKQFRRARKTTNLSNSVRLQLEMYALAASAAGVGMLGLTQPAEAKIVYTPADKHIEPHHLFRLDLNHDGKVDFTLSNFASCGTDQCDYGLFQKPAGIGNSVVGFIFDGQLLLASALNRGARIGPDAGFHKGTADLVEAVYSEGGESTNVLGVWPNVKDRYLGLKFRIHGVTHYGWARLSVAVSRTTIKAILTGYAYETVPNRPILAGKTKRTDVIPVQPASLGQLAQGASGISTWRGTESAAGMPSEHAVKGKL